MEQVIVICGVEPNEAGNCVTVHFQRRIVEDGTVLFRSAPHTVTFLPGCDFAAVKGEINNNVTTRPDMKWPPIPDTVWDEAMAYCAIKQVSGSSNP